MGNDWLPAKREEQLSMGKNWAEVLKIQGGTWNIPANEITGLETAVTNGEQILAQAKSADRTIVITAQCKLAFDTLTEIMREFKNRHFFSPPLTDADFAALGLKAKDPSHTVVPKPAVQAEADLTRPGVHLLELHLRALSGTPAGAVHSDYGFRIYYGVLPPGGASVEAATGPKRELMKAPVSGEELPFSKFTRRKKERFDFPAEDSGRTAFFCIRYENSKGEAGPWGPVFSSVIP